MSLQFIERVLESIFHCLGFNWIRPIEVSGTKMVRRRTAYRLRIVYHYHYYHYFTHGVTPILPYQEENSLEY